MNISFDNIKEIKVTTKDEQEYIFKNSGLKTLYNLLKSHYEGDVVTDNRNLLGPHKNLNLSYSIVEGNPYDALPRN